MINALTDYFQRRKKETSGKHVAYRWRIEGGPEFIRDTAMLMAQLYVSRVAAQDNPQLLVARKLPGESEAAAKAWLGDVGEGQAYWLFSRVLGHTALPNLSLLISIDRHQARNSADTCDASQHNERPSIAIHYRNTSYYSPTRSCEQKA